MYKDIKSLLSEEFEFNVIEVVNPSGLEEHIYLEKFVNGVKFRESEEE
jgi:hypothetical protein